MTDGSAHSSPVGFDLGPYRTAERLGAGGMGVVYKATDTRLGRDVAIKLLQPDLLRDQAAKARFLQESRAAAALNHPNIAVLYDVGEQDGKPYLVMEYLRGRTLERQLEYGPLPLQQWSDYAAGLASALKHAHERGILHRDIKSSNIIITDDGVPKLLDFGLACFRDTGMETRSETFITTPGAWVGTLQFAAPEVLSGHPAEVRSDIYSLGVVFYHMACGILPFAGLQGTALTGAILAGQAPQLALRSLAFPVPLAAVIERAMAAHPEDRYGNVLELIAELQQSSSGSQLPQARTRSQKIPALAILEFQNLAADSGSEWLATGMAETLGADMMRLKSLQVIAPDRVHSTLRELKQTGQDPDPADIGRRLNARWIVTGSYQRAGTRLRVTPRLLDIQTGTVAFSCKIDGDFEQVFALQDQVVREILNFLEVGWDTSDMQRIAAPETNRLEAYEQYSLGRRCFHQLGKASLEDARHHFERALQLDQNYALAHSALGATHAMRFIHRTDPDDLTRALSHLQRALDLDRELAEPYPYLSYVCMRQGKVEQSIAAGLEGVKRQPDLVQAHYFLGTAYTAIGERDRSNCHHAARHILDAIRVEPRWMPSWLVLGGLAVQAGHYQEAEKVLQSALTLERDGKAIGRFIGAEALLATIALRRGLSQEALRWCDASSQNLAAVDHMYREAFVALTFCVRGDVHLRLSQPEVALADYRHAWNVLQEFPRMLGRDRVMVRTLAGLAGSYGATGEVTRANQLLADATSQLELRVCGHSETWIWEADLSRLAYDLGIAHLVAGNPEAALRELRRAVDCGWSDAAWLEHDPLLAPLRSRGELDELVAEVAGLEPLPLEVPSFAMEVPARPGPDAST